MLEQFRIDRVGQVHGPSLCPRVSKCSKAAWHTAMDNSGFQAALDSRVDEMLTACTKCGACFEACPITDAAGRGEADPEAVVAGVLDILRLGEGSKEAE